MLNTAFHKVRSNKNKCKLYLFSVICCFLYCFFLNTPADNTPWRVLSLMDKMFDFVLLFSLINIITVLLCNSKIIFLIISTKQAFQQAGLKNKNDEIPGIIRYENDGQICLLEFVSTGIPISKWNEKKDDIESALNFNISDISYNNGNQNVVIHGTYATSSLPIYLPWEDKYINDNDFVLTLGKETTGLLNVDLRIKNSILIGGSTGSGKSVLLRSLLYQAYRKGAVIHLADFKGGVDYTEIWETMCNIITDKIALLKELEKLIYYLEDRKSTFKKEQVRNIAEYNRKHTSETIPRYIFACDEVAELLDKTGLSKEEKEVVSRIEAMLSTLARQGRAFGIHLILATQRPDANILTGQIKSNIDERICGTADNVLSMIILDSAEAASKVPVNIQGRFITREGKVFQGFYLTDEDVENGIKEIINDI